MRATVSQTAILNAMGSKPYCNPGQGILPMQLQGQTVFNHGQPLSYYADALASANQTVPIDIALALKTSLNATISCTPGQ
jgi:hypothetical protein